MSCDRPRSGRAVSPQAAVEAVTKRSDETVEQYADRICQTPLAVEVKQADLADNTDPQRLKARDAATRARLRAKYQRMTALLSESSRSSRLA